MGVDSVIQCSKSARDRNIFCKMSLEYLERAMQAPRFISKFS
jgi:hypothetical protein